MMEGVKVRMMHNRYDASGVITGSGAVPGQRGLWYYVKPDETITVEDFIRAIHGEVPPGSVERFSQFLDLFGCLGPEGTVGCAPFSWADLVLTEAQPGMPVVFEELTRKRGKPYSGGIWPGTVESVDGTILRLRLDKPLSAIESVDLPDSFAELLVNEPMLDPWVTEISKAMEWDLRRQGIEVPGKVKRGRTTNKFFFPMRGLFSKGGPPAPKVLEAYVLTKPMPVQDLLVRCSDTMPGTPMYRCIFHGARIAVMPIDLQQSETVQKALRPPEIV